MAELADAMDSKSIVRKGVWVQVPLRALTEMFFALPAKIRGNQHVRFASFAH